MNENVYQRQKLYEELWSEPATTVAARYGITSTMLKKICKQLDVPTPPRGYWAKVAAGKTVRAKKLPNADGGVYKCGLGCTAEELAAREAARTFDPRQHFAPIIVRRVEGAASRIAYDEEALLRPLLEEAADRLPCPKGVKRVNYPAYYRFEDAVSDAQKQRVLTYMENFARACESVGGEMTGPLTVSLFGEIVTLRFYEDAEREPHTLTEAEKEAIARYEKGPECAWGKPYIRTWDQRFNGKLRLEVRIGRNKMTTAWMDVANRRFDERRGVSLEGTLIEAFRVACYGCAHFWNVRQDLWDRWQEYFDFLEDSGDRIADLAVECLEDADEVLYEGCNELAEWYFWLYEQCIDYMRTGADGNFAADLMRFEPGRIAWEIKTYALWSDATYDAFWDTAAL